MSEKKQKILREIHRLFSTIDATDKPATNIILYKINTLWKEYFAEEEK